MEQIFLIFAILIKSVTVKNMASTICYDRNTGLNSNTSFYKVLKISLVRKLIVHIIKSVNKLK